MKFPDDYEMVDCLTQHARLDLSKSPPVVTDDPTDTPWNAPEYLRISSYDSSPVVATGPADAGPEQPKP
jgi:hypothetical protein